MQAHACPNVAVRCDVRGCEAQVPRRELLAHFRAAHARVKVTVVKRTTYSSLGLPALQSKAILAGVSAEGSAGSQPPRPFNIRTNFSAFSVSGCAHFSVWNAFIASIFCLAVDDPQSDSELLR